MYGDILPALAAQNPTPYRLMRVLKARTPPLYVSDAVLKQWFLRYFDAEPINSAGHQELKYGGRIREHAEAATFEAAELRAWLRIVLKVDASEHTCQTWRVRSWSTAGRLMSMHDIEHSIGDRLRLPQYRDFFFGEELYECLVVSLSEGQPPVYLAEPFLLRQWYAKYSLIHKVIPNMYYLPFPIKFLTISTTRQLHSKKSKLFVCNDPMANFDFPSPHLLPRTEARVSR